MGQNLIISKYFSTRSLIWNMLKPFNIFRNFSFFWIRTWIWRECLFNTLGPLQLIRDTLATNFRLEKFIFERFQFLCLIHLRVHRCKFLGICWRCDFMPAGGEISQFEYFESLTTTNRSGLVNRPMSDKTENHRSERWVQLFYKFISQ